MPKRSASRYPIEREMLIVHHLGLWRLSVIADRAGVSEGALKSWLWHHGLSARKRWLTSGRAAKLLGVSCQWLTELTRDGAVRGHREPGGRWWLYDPIYIGKLMEGLEQCDTKRRIKDCLTQLSSR